MTPTAGGHDSYTASNLSFLKIKEQPEHMKQIKSNSSPINEPHQNFSSNSSIFMKNRTHVCVCVCRELRVVGLDNPKYFCYMNSVMQILFSINELRKYFFHKEF